MCDFLGTLDFFTSATPPTFYPTSTEIRLFDVLSKVALFLMFPGFFMLYTTRRYGIDGTEFVAWDAWADTRRT